MTENGRLLCSADSLMCLGNVSDSAAPIYVHHGGPSVCERGWEGYVNSLWLEVVFPAPFAFMVSFHAL